MKAYLFKLLSFFIFLLLPVYALANDSTDIVPHKVTNVQPTVVFTNDCLDADNIKAHHTSFYVATYGEKETNCPAGYMARKMKVYVAVGLNFGEWNWKLQCCKTKVVYDN